MFSFLFSPQILWLFQLQYYILAFMCVKGAENVSHIIILEHWKKERNARWLISFKMYFTVWTGQKAL